jgi:hypothetical protein
VCCNGACNGQICRADGQGCVQCDGGAPSCQGGASRTCVNNAFLVTTCGNGCNPATGLCNGLIPLGGAGCAADAQCAGSGASCEGGRCCEFDCVAAGRVCNTNGTCECPSGTTQVGAACQLSNGQECERSDQCASGRCDRWFRDQDGDLYGDPGADLRTCGTINSVPPAGFVASAGDCCDQDVSANPDQATLLAEPNVCGSFDYNCDGAITNLSQFTLDRDITSCDQLPDTPEDCNNVTYWSAGDVPPCGETGTFTACGTSFQGGPIGPCGGITGGPRVNRCL